MKYIGFAVRVVLIPVAVIGYIVGHIHTLYLLGYEAGSSEQG